MKKAIGKILKSIVKGGLNVFGLGSVLDRNKDGKVDFKDFKWYEFAGAVILLSVAVKFDIIDLNVVAEIITSILGH